MGLGAFILAIACAFAFSESSEMAIDPYGEHSTLGCVSGDIQQSNCSINNTGPICTVIVGDFPNEEEVDAYDGNGNCNNSVKLLRQP